MNVDEHVRRPTDRHSLVWYEDKALRKSVEPGGNEVGSLFHVLIRSCRSIAGVPHNLSEKGG